MESEATIISHVIPNTTSDVFDDYLKQIIIEKDIPIDKERFTRINIQDDRLFYQVCDYAKVYNIARTDFSFIYFLESKDFAITILAIDLLDGTTKLHMEPMEISDKFLINLWGNAIDKHNEKRDPRKRSYIGTRPPFPKKNPLCSSLTGSSFEKMG